MSIVKRQYVAMLDTDISSCDVQFKFKRGMNDRVLKFYLMQSGDTIPLNKEDMVVKGKLIHEKTKYFYEFEFNITDDNGIEYEVESDFVSFAGSSILIVEVAQEFLKLYTTQIKVMVEDNPYIDEHSDPIVLDGISARLIPTGGKVGQALIKKSEENYETEWTNSILNIKEIGLGKNVLKRILGSIAELRGISVLNRKNTKTTDSPLSISIVQDDIVINYGGDVASNITFETKRLEYGDNVQSAVEAIMTNEITNSKSIEEHNKVITENTTAIKTNADNIDMNTKTITTNSEALIKVNEDIVKANENIVINTNSINMNELNIIAINGTIDAMKKTIEELQAKINELTKPDIPTTEE
ncbi:MAG: hypothetical protein ACRC42_05170 [Mycoplasma sp.]